MSSLMVWEPFGRPLSLRRVMDRLFEDSFVRPMSGEFSGGNLAVDVYETGDNFVVKAMLPGVKPEDIEVTVLGDTLEIKGEIRGEEEIEKQKYILRERRYGKFRRTVTLPGKVETDKAEAKFENGVLTLSVPKAEEAKSKSIEVKVK